MDGVTAARKRRQPSAALSQPRKKRKQIQDLYFVQKIIQHKIKDGRKDVDYLIKWQGYRVPTWEPAQNINPSILQNYHEDLDIPVPKEAGANLHLNPDTSATRIEPGTSVARLEPGTSAAHLEPGTSATSIEPGISVTRLEPETSAKRLESGTSAARLESGASATRIDPGISDARPEPGTPVACPEPETSATRIEPGASAKCIEPGISDARPEPGTSDACSEPETSVTHLEPGTSAKRLGPGTSATRTEPETSATRFASGTSAVLLDSGASATRLVPETSATRLEPGTPAACLEPGISVERLEPGTSEAHLQPGTPVVHANPRRVLEMRTPPLQRHRRPVGTRRNVCTTENFAVVSPTKHFSEEKGSDEGSDEELASDELASDDDSDWAPPSVNSPSAYDWDFPGVMPPIDPSMSSDRLPLQQPSGLDREHSGQTVDPAPETAVFYKVAPSTKKYDTVNACVFCGKLIKQKMRRHMKLKHSHEIKVGEAMAGTADQQDKKFNMLINAGNYSHNIKVLETGSGEILLKKRPKNPYLPIRKFVPCPGCLAFMLKEDLQQHHSVCPGSDEECMDNATLVTKAENLLFRFARGEVPTFVKEIKDNDIRNVICGDESLLAYANYTVDSKGHNDNHTKAIKARVVKLAKVLVDVRIRKEQPNMSMKDMCHVRFFDDIVNVTKQAAGYKDGTRQTPPTFATPTVPRIVGTALGKVCHVLLGLSMRDENDQLQNDVTMFKRLMENEWGDKMGRASQETLNLRKQNTEKELPTTADMKRLNTHIQETLSKNIQAVRDRASVNAYNKLVCVTAVGLMVFNKRRGGEAMKIQVSDYVNRTAYTQNETVVKSLSPLEKQIMGNMTLIKTRGKRGRTVPVIIPDREKAALDLLLSLRKTVGLQDDKEAYLFAKAPRGTPLNGWYELRKLCKQAGCEELNNITSTNMRKYLATIAQIMNLNENEMDQIATHLGHDITVHRRYYRLPDSTVELSKIAKLLLSTESSWRRPWTQIPQAPYRQCLESVTSETSTPPNRDPSGAPRARDLSDATQARDLSGSSEVRNLGDPPRARDLSGR